MNIEITDLDMILNYLETTSLEPHDDYSSEFTYKDQKILYKYIKQLQQENKQLKEELEEYKNPIKYFKYANKNVTEENKQLKDNWNKLKKYIKTEIPEDVFIDTEWFVSILDKMQELEQGSDNNE